MNFTVQKDPKQLFPGAPADVTERLAQWALCALLLSVADDVSCCRGLYDLRAVYSQCCVLFTRCLLSVSTLRASVFNRDRGVYFLWFV